MSVFHGDEEGVVLRDSEGRPRGDLPYNGAQRYLVKDTELWQHAEEAPVAEVYGAGRADFWRVFDLRSMGLDPVVLGRDSDAELRAHGMSPEYTETTDGGLELVSCGEGRHDARWWIDPARGWNVVRTAVLMDGHEISAMHFTLAQADGVWFPERIECSRQTADGRELTTVMTVLSAEFNRPYHAQELIPADIGIEPGTTLHFGERQPPVTLLWDGRQAISAEDYFTRLKRAEVTRGPTVEREIARLRAGASAGTPEAETTQESPRDGALTTRPTPGSDRPAFAQFESEWEAYTRRFIVRYHLDEDQAQKAWKVCRACEEQGRNIVEKHRDDFQDLERRAASFAGATGQERERQLGKLTERRDALLAPLERIFEQRLKPGLDKLPTPAQRRIGEKNLPSSRPAASQPADVEKRP